MIVQPERPSLDVSIFGNPTPTDVFFEDLSPIFYTVYSPVFRKMFAYCADDTEKGYWVILVPMEEEDLEELGNGRSVRNLMVSGKMFLANLEFYSDTSVGYGGWSPDQPPWDAAYVSAYEITENDIPQDNLPHQLSRFSTQLYIEARENTKLTNRFLKDEQYVWGVDLKLDELVKSGLENVKAGGMYTDEEVSKKLKEIIEERKK